MFEDSAGPIEYFDWGQFRINGEIHSADGAGAGKDIFMVGDKVKPWKARKGHRLQPHMVACALEADISVLVIGCGVHGAIRVTKKTRKAIKAAGVAQLIVETTPEACAAYNKAIREGQQAALLAHGTC